MTKIEFWKLYENRYVEKYFLSRYWCFSHQQHERQQYTKSEINKLFVKKLLRFNKIHCLLYRLEVADVHVID